MKECAIPGSDNRVALRRRNNVICNQLFDADAQVIPDNRRIPCKVLRRDARRPDANPIRNNQLVSTDGLNSMPPIDMYGPVLANHGTSVERSRAAQLLPLHVVPPS